MSVLQTKKHINKLYKDIYKTVKKEFQKALAPITEEIYIEALEMGFDGEVEDLDESFIEEFFEEYNPVTKYVFKNEIDRKNSRLFESVVASTNEIHQSYKTAENLITKQVKQYAIDLEDKVAKTVYKALGIEKVMWVSEMDHKTCSVCAELDGEIFPLNEAPPKQHYNCRCVLTPVKG
jgi:SPP1 gp7 family putative phage head morphogenesis protein